MWAAIKLGDTVEVINASTGQVLDTYFSLSWRRHRAWEESRLKGQQRKKIDYIYTKQNSHSMGAAFVSKKQLSIAKGATRLFIDGRFDWILAPMGDKGIRVYAGTFKRGPR